MKKINKKSKRKKILEDEMKKNLFRRKNQSKENKKISERRNDDFNV